MENIGHIKVIYISGMNAQSVYVFTHGEKGRYNNILTILVAHIKVEETSKVFQ